jgi:hypothetical protein
MYYAYSVSFCFLLDHRSCTCTLLTVSYINVVVNILGHVMWHQLLCVPFFFSSGRIELDNLSASRPYSRTHTMLCKQPSTTFLRDAKTDVQRCCPMPVEDRPTIDVHFPSVGRWAAGYEMCAFCMLAQCSVFIITLLSICCLNSWTCPYSPCVSWGQASM